MLERLRIHKATVKRVVCSGYDEKFYTIRVMYERKKGEYSILLYDGTKKMKTFKKFLNVNKLQELEGKTISYISANDLNISKKVEIWMLVNKNRTSFYDLKTGDILTAGQLEKKLKKSTN